MSSVRYDYLVVGAGLYGATFAQQMKAAGKSCLVIDKREHIAGNCFTYNYSGRTGSTGINVHKYGPHIFHTSSKDIWEYVHRFAEFNHFSYRPKVNYYGNIYSFPLNMMTFYQLWGCKTPAEAKRKIEEVRVKIENPGNLSEYILSELGEEIYYVFFEGYTTKQWGRHPSLLPASIVRRLPVRYTYDDNYYRDIYQGIPQGGYTQMVENMLDGIDIQLNTPYKDDMKRLARKVVYSGPIDQFFNYKYGALEYRSLDFVHKEESGDFQGIAGVNHTGLTVPYTRSVEHKHFEFVESDESIVTYEYPKKYTEGEEPYYPVNDEYNNTLYKKYEEETLQNRDFIFGGRLGTYKYYDMHQVIGGALAAARRELNGF